MSEITQYRILVSKFFISGAFLTFLALLCWSACSWLYQGHTLYQQHYAESQEHLQQHEARKLQFEYYHFRVCHGLSSGMQSVLSCDSQRRRSVEATTFTLIQTIQELVKDSQPQRGLPQVVGELLQGTAKSEGVPVCSMEVVNCSSTFPLSFLDIREQALLFTLQDLSGQYMGPSMMHCESPHSYCTSVVRFGFNALDDYEFHLYLLQTLITMVMFIRYVLRSKISPLEYWSQLYGNGAVTMPFSTNNVQEAKAFVNSVLNSSEGEPSYSQTYRHDPFSPPTSFQGLSYSPGMEGMRYRGSSTSNPMSA